MRIIVLALAFILFIVGSAMYLGSNSAITPDQIENISDTVPWIEVLSPTVLELDPKTKSVVRELSTEDELAEGSMIDVGTGALANIYFPDGSVARIDSETQFTIHNAGWELSIGRIWFNIKSLVTTGSEWYVETPNAVATIHGTAFGVEYNRGKSHVIVFESEVTVEAKDQSTGERLAYTKTSIKPDEFVVLDAEIVRTLKIEQKALQTQHTTSDLLERTWIKRSREAELIAPSPRPQSTRIQDAQAVELKINSLRPLEKLFEGDLATLEAQLVFSDGSTKNVTPEVEWFIIGDDIGFVSKEGTLTPRLGASIAEFGSGSGVVLGAWKNPETGKEILGKTKNFQVEAKLYSAQIVPDSKEY